LSSLVVVGNALRLGPLLAASHSADERQSSYGQYVEDPAR
jgi:hypothetical protein